MRLLILVLFLSGCGGLAWNTTVADAPSSRWAMLASVVPGQTTEKRFVAQWGNPTQKIREGAQVSYVYRNMNNPWGYPAPQFGDSSQFVVVTFQYGLAIGGYSSDTQGCRATFAPRPPGQNFDNPTTVHPVNCSGLPNPPGPGDSVQTVFTQPLDAAGIGSRNRPGVPSDAYLPDGKLK
ncbi:MAG: hypothetical protein HKN27_17515 [Silicimonas sp.]|nr:hypothetical protein [Silicimonas sp.]